MSDYLPVEVIIDILKWLPVKSVVKFRSVCKTWNSLICDPSFVSAHCQAYLSRPPNNTPLLLIISFSVNGKDKYSLHYDNDVFDELKKLQYPVFDSIWSPMYFGSCNGLVCLGSYAHNPMRFVFWNPSIQKYISLPQPDICCIDYASRLNSAFGFGFGFDSRTNDYKILTVRFDKANHLIQPSLFSLRENCWTMVVAIAPNYEFDDETSMTFVNGAVHWLGYQRRNSDGFKFNYTILGFDLSAEEFFEISFPESFTCLPDMELSTMKYGQSSIAVVKLGWEDGELLEMWVMKEYGVVESWTKVLALYMGDRSELFPRVLGFRNNGEVLLQVDEGEMAPLDLNRQLIKPHGVKIGEYFLSVESYMESLVLLDKAIGVCSVSDANHVIDSTGRRVKRHRTGP
ncbi:F-box/kelch-repeat protein At3g23880-like [Hibiscus syriacus]|uniref:F-box/kelch-repeat protein At3g23880-like n=1 Tax=Hibiscus syriacus TaxID=106335 RepID=UPI001923BCEE|nr:F-box/kelch-repeat protein At3g23880-like [Hibiscus syriacus]